jgi:alpha-tubulin suppressor-like RCC1 family protein
MQITPYRIQFFGYQIKTIDVKESNAIALSTNGIVFTWGTNSRIVYYEGACKYMSSYVPVIVDELYQYKHVISNVYCGERFFVATSVDSYNLLTWGHWCTYTHNTPIQRVSGMHLGLSRKIHNVSCTNTTTYCLLTTGALYYWKNWDGRNPLPELNPIQIPNIPFIRSISSGTTHSACIDIHGNLYVWGVIMSPDIINQPNTPLLIGRSDIHIQYTHVKCGIDSLVVLDNENSLHCWGKNTSNKLSDSNTNVFHTLTKMDNENRLDF